MAVRTSMPAHLRPFYACCTAPKLPHAPRGASTMLPQRMLRLSCTFLLHVGTR